MKGVFDRLKSLKIPDSPSWQTDPEFPKTSEMLKDIVENRNNWITDTHNTSEYLSKMHQLKLSYVLHSNCGEGEGTQTIKSTEKAVNKTDNERILAEEQVSRNIFAALNHLEKRNVGDENAGFLDIEECIQDTHQILMKNVIEPKKCGEFSTNCRVTITGTDNIHVYPTFATNEEAFDAIQNIIDKYNDTIHYIKTSNLDPSEQTSMYIRCAAWILYKFLSLHPFADGNGRMSRLLASHCLYSVFPFPCPIYNIYAPTDRNVFLNAIKKARDFDGNELGDLVALIIESGWWTANQSSKLADYIVQA